MAEDTKMGEFEVKKEKEKIGEGSHGFGNLKEPKIEKKEGVGFWEFFSVAIRQEE